MTPIEIDMEVMNHIAMHGNLKSMDPYLLHIFKTSPAPVLRARRNWIYEEGTRQAREAEYEQKKMIEEFKEQPVRRGCSVRRRAVIHPYYMAKEAAKHNAKWTDPDFLSVTKRDNPEIFPQRTP